MTYSSATSREAEERERLRLKRLRAASVTAPPLPQFRNRIKDAQSITDHEWLLAGPAETGKTWGVLWRLDSEARTHKNSSWVLARKVRATMNSTVLQTWQKVIAIRGGVEVFGGEQPIFYRYTDSGAKVWIVGMDKPDKILSGEFDGIVTNQTEEFDEDDWEVCTTRTTGRGAVTPTPMVWGDCNPGPEDHWIVRRGQSKKLIRLDTTHADNPTLYTEDGTLTAQGIISMRTLDALTGVRYQRLRLGRWVGAEGQYFDQLDADLHIRPAPDRALWRHWWLSLDYGWSHPLSCGLFCETEDKTVWVVDLHHAQKLTVQQHADKLDALCARHGITRSGLQIVAGHDCWASRGGDDPETIADKFDKRGYKLERAVIDRINGARAVGERLGNPEAQIAPTLFFDPRARAVFDTLARMVHSPRDAEDVLKVDADAEGRGGDDAYDMCRYGVMTRATPRGADLVDTL